MISHDNGTCERLLVAFVETKMPREAPYRVARGHGRRQVGSYGGDGAAALFTAPLRPPLIASDDRPLVDMICFLQMGARLPSFSQPTPHACNASSADVDAARLLSKVNISPTPTTLRARGNYLHTTAHRLSGGAARLRCGYGTGGQSPQVHR